MRLAQFPQLQQLTRSQKLKLAEELWLEAVDDSEPMSPQHRRLVDGRWKDYRAGKEKRISMAELEARVARR
jgi:hypothetical protein